MTNHSPEPWRAVRAFSPLEDANHGNLCYLDHSERICLNPADLRRIVACVNACTGIPTEDLEGFASKAAEVPMSRYLGWVGYYLTSEKMNGQETP